MSVIDRLFFVDNFHWEVIRDQYRQDCGVVFEFVVLAVGMDLVKPFHPTLCALDQIDIDTQYRVQQILRIYVAF